MTTKIIVIKETWADSLISDIGTFATFAGMIGLGVWLESPAMQWIGGTMFLVGTFNAVSSKTLRGMTIAQARAELDRIEAAE